MFILVEYPIKVEYYGVTSHVELKYLFKDLSFFSETGKENFIVMLFNDESHTYEEVIDTLQTAVPNCRKNHAIHFATIVDKMVYYSIKLFFYFFIFS